MRVLNLYAGIGGNRKLWEGVEVTAVENVPHIADVYRQLFPNDTVIEADAHQYLLDHYKEFDFIWSSPPCPTHSKLQIPNNAIGIIRYPDMRLYQEIIFLKQFCRVPFVVENVIGYYTPLVPPTRELQRHYFWTNFYLSKYYHKAGSIDLTRQGITNLQKYLGIDLTGIDLTGIDTIEKRKLLRNCVHPQLGLHVFNCTGNLKQEALV